MTSIKRLDTAAFQTWIAKNQFESNEGSTNSVHTLDRQSIATLARDIESKKIIASPREYQIELFERAKQRNTIVVLDTGTHTLDQELEERACGKQKRVAFFLVEKVALCFQQHAVLSCNLEHPIAKFYGDMKGVMKTKEFWDSKLSENMVLLDCLHNAFITMRQINLLIFDEAHHTKKNHPYARIIKDHYIRLEKQNRPRVMGMTASPVDCQTRDIKIAAAELESMLCKFPENSATTLWYRIYEQVASNSQFRPSLEFTKEASSTLGRWCADRCWQLFLTDSELVKLSARTDRDFAQDFASNGADQAVDSIRQVQSNIKRHDLGTIKPGSQELSSKVRCLYEILKDAFTQFSTKRCIVFVEKRFTACLLTDLFQQKHMRIQDMKVGYVVGSQATTTNLGNMSYRDQFITLQRFKKGEINCLFATPVAEEGIDIPECDLVVRFDLFNSVIQYLQSKGRARQRNSRYISMVEEGNTRHLRSLAQATRDAHALRRFCSALPADRKLQDQVTDVNALAKFEEAGQKVFEIPETGARLTFPHSLEVLAQFVSSLSPSEMSYKPEYIVTTYGSKFQADVILPDSSPIKSMQGFPQRSKMLARCSAAFETCVALIMKKHIGDNLQPAFAKKLHAMRNARLAVTSNKRSSYDMLLRPKIWSKLGTPSELFVTAIALENPGALSHSSRPLLLLSRQRLSQVPEIPLYFGNGQSSLARCNVLANPLKITGAEFAALAHFTLRTFFDVFSKEFETDHRELPYFLAPCIQSHSQVVGGGQAELDWASVNLVKETDTLDWVSAPEEFFSNRLVIDPWDGSRRFYINGINQSLKPSDPTPKGVPEPRSRAYRQTEKTVKDYSNSLFLKSRKRVVWRDDQPVVNAELLSLRRNLLDEHQVDEEMNNQCFIILEPLEVSPLPIEFVSMAMTFPAIIHRIDSVLIALEACSLLGLEIRANLALEALTKDSDNTGDHGKEQINFQAGMGHNYERLEFLGDSFLKMATTVSLFTLLPESTECEYHIERMLLVCNQNLFNHAVDRDLQGFIRSRSFNRRTWYPGLKLKRGKAPKTEMRHELADKSIADVCEALIGAAYVSAGEGNVDLAVKAVTEMVRSKNHKMQKFSDYYAAFKVPVWQAAVGTAAQRFVVQQIATITGYRFKSAPLLRSAFKHPSYPYETLPHYQRLEFLGDALLDMAIVDYLFKRYPEADPQWLTEHKMAMASNQFLGVLCVRLNLQKHLLTTSSALMGNIADYTAELEQAEEAAQKEAREKGVPMRNNFWLDVGQPPKALPDIVEALIGAMFVDAEYNYAVVQSFFRRFILPYFEDMQLYDTFANRHPVTFLAHKMQNEVCCSQWRICTSNVPCSLDQGIRALTESDVVCAVMVHGKVFTHATAKSGRYAKVAVAKKALAMLADVSVVGVKRLLGCDCNGLP
ncbi:hypothetical protein BGZ63DRAFT_440387 [Mariannaea sp. PMI_226]|nr:hypothetical protein BGZ63DRAFT_440387 [Mariannaea sp. PMI_226]